MGKKRIASRSSGSMDSDKKSRSLSKSPKKRHGTGVLHIQSTYNNTKLTLADPNGNTLAWSTSGALGFKGAKKGTPFAASKIGDHIADKADQIGMKSVDIVVNGVGSGRESAIRAFTAKGISIISIKDVTAVPFNGPRPRKVRRV